MNHCIDDDINFQFLTETNNDLNSPKQNSNINLKKETIPISPNNAPWQDDPTIVLHPNNLKQSSAYQNSDNTFDLKLRDIPLPPSSGDYAPKPSPVIPSSVLPSSYAPSRAAAPSAAAVNPLFPSRAVAPSNISANSYSPYGGKGSIDGPPTTFATGGLPAFLIRQIGKYVRVEFILGTQAYMDRNGVLHEVGTNYIVLRELGSQQLTVCDLYSIKFVNVFDIPPQEIAALSKNALNLTEYVPSYKIPVSNKASQDTQGS